MFFTLSTLCLLASGSMWTGYAEPAISVPQVPQPIKYLLIHSLLFTNKVDAIPRVPPTHCINKFSAIFVS